MPQRFASPRHFNQLQLTGRQQEMLDQIFVRVRRLERRIVLARASPRRISENRQNRQFSPAPSPAPTESSAA
jgi:hypothetical protein